MIDLSTRNGVLNDWDLSRQRVGHGSTRNGAERTGTIPYMALDLLDPEALDGRVPRLYRHDLEGLVWILVWVFIQYEGRDRTAVADGKSIIGQQFVMSSLTVWATRDLWLSRTFYLNN